MKFNIINSIIEDLISNGISVNLLCQKSIDDCETIGTFDHENMTVSVALWSSHGVNTLVHEYGHFLQWRDRNEWYLSRWSKGRRLGEYIADNARDIKVHGHNKKEMAMAFKSIVQLEHDCEKFTINYIREHSTPSELKRYIKGANEYLLRLAGMYKLEIPYEDVKIDPSFKRGISNEYLYDLNSIIQFKNIKIFG